MRYDWSISLSGPLNSKVCFDGQNVSGRKFWNTFKGKVRTNKKNKTQKQISQTFESVSSRFWRKTSDEWRRRARRRQLDSRSRWFHRRRKVVKHKMKKTRKTKCEWKTFEGFADSRQMEILMNERTRCCSRKAPWQVLEDVPKQNVGEYEPDSISSFWKSILQFSSSCSSFSICAFLQKPCKVGSTPKRCHILLSSLLQTSATFPTVSLILFSPPGSFH